MDLTQLFSNDEVVAKIDDRLANIDGEITRANEELDTAVRQAEERRNAAVAGLEETRTLLQAKRDELAPVVVVEAPAEAEAVAEVQ